MTTNRPDIEKIFGIVRKKVTNEDLEWFKKESPDKHKILEEQIGNKEDISNIKNAMILTLSIQYFIDAINREISNNYQCTDIPKDYVSKLAKILDMTIPKKFTKKAIIDEILKK